MKTAAPGVISRIYGNGRGWVFSAKDFLDLGSRATVDQVLSRLAKRGKIRRLRQGLYDFPKTSQLVGIVPPNGGQLISALSRKLKGGLQVNPALAANSLGLSTQVPAHQIYFTKGLSRTIQAGGVVLTLKHAGNRQMLGAGKPAGTVYQALRALKSSLDSDVIQRLAKAVPSDRLPAIQRDLSQAPIWAKKALEKIQAAASG